MSDKPNSSESPSVLTQPSPSNPEPVTENNLPIGCPLSGAMVITDRCGVFPWRVKRDNQNGKATRVGWHNGLDLRASIGTPVYATADGTVRIVTNSANGGKYVVLKHANEYYTAYYHLNDFAVKTGQYVNKGTVIAYSGNTGGVAPHLHYEIWKNAPFTSQGGTPINPEKMLRHGGCSFSYKAGIEIPQALCGD